MRTWYWEEKKNYYLQLCLIWQKPEEFLKLFQNWRIPFFPLKFLPGVGSFWHPVCLQPLSDSPVWLSWKHPCASQEVTALPCRNPQYQWDHLLICWFESAFSAAWLEWSIAGWGLKCEISTKVLVGFKCLPTSECFSHTLINIYQMWWQLSFSNIISINILFPHM